MGRAAAGGLGQVERSAPSRSLCRRPSRRWGPAGDEEAQAEPAAGSSSLGQP